MASHLEEGWYLMSVADLEAELARMRDPKAEPATGTLRMTVEEALAYRNAGNVPDELGRTLRLVLETGSESLESKRLRYEPDFHEAPTWRRPGSKPVNIVPLRTPRDPASSDPERAWWEQEDVAGLEAEWRATGAIAGVVVPADYRSFVIKTIASLRQAGLDVTVPSIVASVARWLAPEQVDELARALEAANPSID